MPLKAPFEPAPAAERSRTHVLGALGASVGANSHRSPSPDARRWNHEHRTDLPLADSWGMHGDVGAGWMIGMMVLMVLFWGGVILGIVWLIRGVARGGSAPGERLVNREGPVEIIERRFAEGEITAEDYRARREVLVGGTAEANPARKRQPLTTPPAAQGRR